MKAALRTVVIDVSDLSDEVSDELLRDRLQPAVEILKRGGIVAFPTETVYGLGARYDDPQAIRRIYEAKGRPADNPLISHISSVEMLKVLTREENFDVALLSEAFWPGALTLVLPKRPEVPDDVTAGLDTVGVRMPNHRVARELVHLTGVPIAAPSANRSGRPSPTTGQHVLDDLDGRVDAVVIDRQPLIGLESTVVDLSVSPPVILRPGSVTKEQLELVLDREVVASDREENVPKAPGMKYRHYAPDVELVLYRTARPGDADHSLMSIGEDAVGLESYGVIRLESEGSGGDSEHGIGSESAECSRAVSIDRPLSRAVIRNIRDLDDYASSLFHQLREFEQLGVERIYAPTVEEKGLGVALMNRLRKAATRTIDF